MSGDSSEEVDLGGFAPKSKAGQSGINLTKPSDSGVSLEKKGPKTGPLNRGSAPSDDDSDEFELSLDTSSPSSRKLGPKTGPLPRNRSRGPELR